MLTKIPKNVEIAHSRTVALRCEFLLLKPDIFSLKLLKMNILKDILNKLAHLTAAEKESRHIQNSMRIYT